MPGLGQVVVFSESFETVGRYTTPEDTWIEFGTGYNSYFARTGNWQISTGASYEGFSGSFFWAAEFTHHVTDLLKNGPRDIGGGPKHLVF